MSRSLRFLWQPRWVLGHLFVLAAVVTMLLLGRWQLGVSNRRHFDLQNSAYAVQWWAFAAFAVFFWFRVLRDQIRRASGAPEPQVVAPPVKYKAYVRPQVAPDRGDSVNQSYNSYLAALANDESERPT